MTLRSWEWVPSAFGKPAWRWWAVLAGVALAAGLAGYAWRWSSVPRPPQAVPATSPAPATADATADVPGAPMSPASPQGPVAQREASAAPAPNGKPPQGPGPVPSPVTAPVQTPQANAALPQGVYATSSTCADCGWVESVQDRPGAGALPGGVAVVTGAAGRGAHGPAVVLGGGASGAAGAPASAFELRIRMADGRLRTFVGPQAWPAGTAVTVRGDRVEATPGPSEAPAASPGPAVPPAARTGKVYGTP